MRYSVTDDKRNAIECFLYLISCIICVALEVFLLNKIVINDPTLRVLWILFQCAVSISPVFIVWVIKKFLCNFLLKICNIKNLSGTYNVEIQSNYKKGTYEPKQRRLEAIAKILNVSISIFNTVSEPSKYFNLVFSLYYNMV